MHDQERVKLLHGPYHLPRCKVGRLIRCRRFGKVRVRGLTAASISWPFTRKQGGGGRPILILCAGLVRAVQRESETAVAH